MQLCDQTRQPSTICSPNAIFSVIRLLLFVQAERWGWGPAVRRVRRQYGRAIRLHRQRMAAWTPFTAVRDAAAFWLSLLAWLVGPSVPTLLEVKFTYTLVESQSTIVEPATYHPSQNCKKISFFCFSGLFWTFAVWTCSSSSACRPRQIGGCHSSTLQTSPKSCLQDKAHAHLQTALVECSIFIV